MSFNPVVESFQSSQASYVADAVFWYNMYQGQIQQNLLLNTYIQSISTEWSPSCWMEQGGSIQSGFSKPERVPISIAQALDSRGPDHNRPTFYDISETWEEEQAGVGEVSGNCATKKNRYGFRSLISVLVLCFAVLATMSTVTVLAFQRGYKFPMQGVAESHLPFSEVLTQQSEFAGNVIEIAPSLSLAALPSNKEQAPQLAESKLHSSHSEVPSIENAAPGLRDSTQFGQHSAITCEPEYRAFLRGTLLFKARNGFTAQKSESTYLMDVRYGYVDSLTAPSSCDALVMNSIWDCLEDGQRLGISPDHPLLVQEIEELQQDQNQQIRMLAACALLVTDSPNYEAFLDKFRLTFRWITVKKYFLRGTFPLRGVA